MSPALRTWLSLCLLLASTPSLGCPVIGQQKVVQGDPLIRCWLGGLDTSREAFLEEACTS